MTLFPRIASRLWIIFPLIACGFLVWASVKRVERVEYVSQLAGRAEAVDAIDPKSPTGYAHGQRELIVPERNENSFNLIAQTQQMFAHGEWRVRHVEYDNAPLGRDVNATSPARWWLGLVAAIDHAISSRPIGRSVECAALYANPILHGLLLIGAAVFVAWRFGVFAAALLSVGLVALFPLAAGFLPGVPDNHALARGFGFFSILVLIAGIGGEAQRNRWFALAGVAGGLGLWIDVPTQVPIITGILFGGLIAACMSRRKSASRDIDLAASWQVWATSGATTIFLAYLIEYAPGHLGAWNLETIHPVYGLAWLGGGVVLARITTWSERGVRGKNSWRLGDICVVLLSAVAIASVPVAMKLTNSPGFLILDLPAVRLTDQPGGVVAVSFWAWLTRDGLNAKIWATFLPLTILVLAGWMMIQRSTKSDSRTSLAIALGPVLIALGFACQRLSWWSMCDGALLVLMVAVLAGHRATVPKSTRWLWAGVAVLFTIPGVIQLLPQKSADATMKLTRMETEELVERHLAHWLAKRAGDEGAIVFAPPHQSTTLGFYGGLRGLGTFAFENRTGFGLTLNITGANTIDEARAVIDARGVRYLVVPSWDPFFEEFARLYLVKQFSNRTSVLIQELRRGNVPPWLKPLAYQIPEISGFEEQSVLVFEVVDQQSPAVATSRLAEYLVEMGKLAQASAVGEALRRFPADLSALAARAQVMSASGDAAGTGQIWDALQARLANGADRVLPWDRRVSLAIVLAQADRIELASAQVRRCIAEIDANKVRALSPGSLYRLLVLSHALSIEIADPKLRELALQLLPADLRSRL